MRRSLPLLLLLLIGCSAPPVAQQPMPTLLPTAPALSSPPTPTPVPTPTRRTSPAAATLAWPTVAPAVRPRSPAPTQLRLAIGEPDTADPQQASFENDIELVMLTYLPLMTYDADLNLIPGAAERYIVSADGLVYTFHLRPGQTYSDGAPLTAANFEFAFRRWADPLIAGDYQDQGFIIAGFQAYAQSLRDVVDLASITDTAHLAQQARLRAAIGVRAVDDLTLEVRLTQPAAYFPHLAALWATAPVREDLIARGGDWWWRNPATNVGNGPFQLSEWLSGDHIMLRRNPRYALAANRPSIEEIKLWLTSGSSEDTLAAYRSNQVDMVLLDANTLPIVQTLPYLASEAVSLTGSCTFYFGYNFAAPPFDTRAVRQSFSQALDRTAYIQDVMYGVGQKTLALIPPSIPGYAAQPRFDFDPGAATALLAAADFTHTQPDPFNYPGTTRGKQRFEWLAQQLLDHAQLRLKLHPIDAGGYYGLAPQSQPVYPIFYLGWCPDYPDPHDILSLLFHTGGISAGRIGYSNPQFDALVDAADRELDAAKRQALYRQAQDFLINDQPVAFMANDLQIWLVKPWVTGLRQTAFDRFPGLYSLGTLRVTP